MKRIILGATILLPAVLAFSSLASCNKKNETLPPDTTVVLYALTGNYSGRVAVVYTGENGAQVRETVGLPWTKAVTFRGNATLQSGGRTSEPDYGNSAETVTVKLYIGNQMRTSATAVADARGMITLPDISTRIK